MRRSCRWRKSFVWFGSGESDGIGDTQFFYETIPPSDLIYKSRKMGVDLEKTFGLLGDSDGQLDDF